MGRGPRALSSDCTPWDDVDFWLPDAAARARVTVYYQTATRHYIEALRDGNVIDDWGQILYDLWLKTDKAAPVPIVSAEIYTAIRDIILNGNPAGKLDPEGPTPFNMPSQLKSIPDEEVDAVITYLISIYDY